ncbi:nitrate reductase molybdenum cofactor assembly chaperone [Nitrospirillum sp. BR 11828]|uniref:nitrate reductase molybdenum cofactor assembly chaperone n=1 Tax=Nitrospirillum sp. BR 11828 TaxID=3104325 RepID=UPI002ACA8D5C|nr:nitrate reductase molybdenum cofactor assembly chaperone [Nitrospirillum sp. BR 11828]MDZ5649852.1 nitrate reductase molybdenum cofactor assembly chaperone [Nitrospirillum sp. BR 11828]
MATTLPIGTTPTLKALSALLTYPTPALIAVLPEIGNLIIAQGHAADGLLRPLLDDLAGRDLYDLQESYVDLFDRSRRLSLHLFEHVHGESRDRGQAMVDLAAHYENAGLSLAVNELPDYLPLFLEFLSTRPEAEARALLGETAAILATLEERLAKRGSLYAPLFTLLLALTEAVGAEREGADTDDHEANDLAALDAEWEEAAVTFGPGTPGDGCSVDRLRTRLRAERRDARHSAHS